MKLIGSHNRWTLCLLRRKNYEKRWLLFFVQLKSVIPSLWFALEDFFGRVTRRKIEWTDVTSDSQVVMAPLFGMKILSSSSTSSSTKIFSPFLWCGKKIVFSAVLPMSNIQWNSSLDFIRLFLVIWIGWCGQKKHHLPFHDLVQWIGMSNDLILVVECIYYGVEINITFHDARLNI